MKSKYQCVDEIMSHFTQCVCVYGPSRKKKRKKKGRRREFENDLEARKKKSKKKHNVDGHTSARASPMNAKIRIEYFIVF